MIIAAAALVLLLGGAPLLPPPPAPPLAVTAVPDEPGALMLPEAPTYQAVAADVDGDGVRDLVRMVGTPRDGIDLEAWRERAGDWERLGEAVAIVPEQTSGPSRSSLVYAGAPMRLVVRRVEGIERATLVRQPRFDEPGLDQTCCLLLDDVVFRSGALELDEVSPRSHSADAVLAIDMDGDATDELLITRGLPPLGGITFPTEARLLRWAGSAFAPPVPTELSVGSGFSPYVLGDSDGVPGDEAAFIGAQDRLHRISLRDGDALAAESAESGVGDAIAAPIGDERGIATASSLRGLEVRHWPRDAPPGDAVGVSQLDGDLLGVVAHDGSPELALVSSTSAILYVGLPDLDTISDPRRLSAADLGQPRELRPFIGMLPGGGPRGQTTIFAGGEIATSESETAVTSSLAGVVPVGLVGRGRSWLALWHGVHPGRPLDPIGGPLNAPVAPPGSGVSLVPYDAVSRAEADGGTLDPPVDGAIVDGEALLVGDAGFGVLIDAPPGSRAYVRPGWQLPTDIRVVPEAGSMRIDVLAPEDAEPNPAYVARVTVVTPSGRAYVARWDVNVLDEPPTLAATAETAPGSPSVVIAGHSAPGATVLVGGRAIAAGADGGFNVEVQLPPWPTEVEVVATDRLGNESRLAVVGVGWFDYRTLPWVAIALVALGGVGLWVAVRAPRARELPAPDTDDATLEEMDSDDG